jgi:hypothetical protein
MSVGARGFSHASGLFATYLIVGKSLRITGRVQLNINRSFADVDPDKYWILSSRSLSPFLRDAGWPKPPRQLFGFDRISAAPWADLQAT